MLVRSSQRRLQRQAARNLQSAYEQLQLPWLCPAIFDHGASQIRRSTTNSAFDKGMPLTSNGTRPARKPSPMPKDPPGRGFATPAISYNLDAQDEYIPFESPAISRHWERSQSLTELPVWDTSNIRSLSPEAQLSPSTYARKQGTSAEAEEMHAVLEAHLHIGQFERAASTLRRLGAICDLGSPRLHSAYLAYLATIVSHIVVTKNDALWNTLRRWFNEDFRAKGLKPNPTVITLLVQASLRGPKQNKIARSIRHFLHLAEKDGILVESLAEIEDSLSAEEFNNVKEAAPTFFEAAEVESANPSEFVPPSENRPTILAQSQKGSGLTTLHTALESFYSATTAAASAGAEHKGMSQTALRQLQIEQDVSKAAMDRWEADSDQMMQRATAHNIVSQQSVGALAWRWHQTLVPLIEEALSAEMAKKGKGAQSEVEKALFPYLQHMSARKLAAITIMSVIESTVRVSKHVGILRVVSQLGRDIQDECVAQLIKFRNREWMSRHRSSKERARKLHRLVRDEHLAPSQRLYEEVLPSGENEWTPTTVTKVGGLFLHLLTQAANIQVRPSDHASTPQAPEVYPAFRTEKTLKQGRWLSVLTLHPKFHELLRSKPPTETISKHLPMLMEPIPWTGWKRGGYIQQPVAVVRTNSMHADTRDYIKLAIEKGDMDQVFSGLDILSRTPWRINKPVLDVMSKAWNTGEAFAKFPPANAQAVYPSEPTDMNDKQARKIYSYECKKADDERDGQHSNRCFINFQLEVARAYMNETFYFPHNMDFRGRAYPIPPYLNHMGADHCRGLLQFGKGRELGEHGLRWLRIQLANVFGFDKASLNEREQFTIDNMDLVRDSAANPLEGQKWWLKADDPWQCLAACFELLSAESSPDPTKFVSYLPIHQDGTCNGLQHYAALGGDKVGAAQVNLEPGERPADIYSAVANMVQQSVSRDVLEGHEIAKKVDGKIKRKIVKQTVMTNVYGVTMSGAKDQIVRQLDDHYPGDFKDLRLGSYTAATYLAKKVFDAMATMFNGAHEIQYWLGDCAGRICKSLSLEQVRHIEENMDELLKEQKPLKRLTQIIKFGEEETRLRSPVVWTTPLRMPVVQPYRTTISKQVNANFVSLAVNSSSPKDPIHKRKQVTAFPPNFIHSLDATHMLLSALKCDERGLTFASVHDSFWTHASDVDTLSNTLRDAFIRMHSEDIIGRLAAEMAARYKGYMHLVPIPRHSKAGRKIAALPGLKKQTHLARIPLRKQFLRDLITERTRLRLLESEDSEERLEGENLLTPGKILSDSSPEDIKYNIEEDNLNRVLKGVPEDVQRSVLARFAKELEGKKASISQDELAEEQNDLPPQENAAEQEPTYVVDALDVSAEAPGLASQLTSNTELIHEDKEREELEQKILKKLRLRKSKFLHVWAPLTIPVVPQKGDFDVSRINESKYFFS